jgi:DNA-binding MarR family transcriptional regulator
LATQPATTGRAELILTTMRQIEELYRSRRGISSREWLDCDLTMPQLKVLMFLYTDAPARVSDIAASLGVTLPTATALVDRLVDRRLAERKGLEGDRRVVLCALTAEGLRMAQGLRRVAEAHIHEILDALDQNELEEVARAFALLHRGAQRGGATTRARR